MNFLELYVEVVGNSFVQCISYRNCCVYLECSTLQLCSPYLGSNRPTATDSCVWSLMLMDFWNILTIIVKISSYLSIAYTAKCFNGGERRYIPQRFLTVEQIGNMVLTQASIETFSKYLVFLLMKTLSKHVQVIVV